MSVFDILMDALFALLALLSTGVKTLRTLINNNLGSVALLVGVVVLVMMGVSVLTAIRTIADA